MKYKFLFYIFLVTVAAADDSGIQEYKRRYASLRAGIDDFITDESPPGDKCNNDDSEGACIPYYQCVNGTFKEKGETGGYGVIDIRYDGDKPCASYLDKCCEIPPGGFPIFPTPPTGDLNGSDSFEERETLPPPGLDPPIGTPPPIPVVPKATPSYCGVRNEYGIDFKIMGNKDDEAEYGEFPWMVAVIKSGKAPDFLCGGSLLTPNVVLTAAHCINLYENSPSRIKIRAGEWDTQTTRERVPNQEREVKKIIIHENFDKDVLYNDVALLILSRNVIKADNVGTVCLPSRNMVVSSTECFVTGWGKDVFGKQGRYQSILKKIQLPTVPKDKCQSDLRKTRLGYKFALDESFTCAGGEVGKDACTGDGGSPLVCPDPHNPARYVQVGIVAWGIGCGSQNVPGVYVDVAKFRVWIDAHMEKLEIDTLPYNN